MLLTMPSPTAATADQMLHWLAQVARVARETAAQQIPKARIAQLLDVAPSTVTRFEAGEAWPRNPDATMAAYAYLTGREPAELWEAALHGYMAAGEEFDPSRFLKLDEIPSAPQESFVDLFSRHAGLRRDGAGRAPASRPTPSRRRRGAAG